MFDKIILSRIDRFDALIDPWILDKEESPDAYPWKVSETVLTAQKDKVGITNFKVKYSFINNIDYFRLFAIFG